MLNSPLYAYNGINADNGISTADSQLCAAAWYRNDLGLGGGGEFITAYHMQVNVGPGCGPPGYNIWSTSPRVDAAAGCVGCPRQLQTCPSYTLMNEALSWSDANAACLAKGLHLASVLSATENALLVTAAAGNDVWIGGTDAASEGTWKWIASGAVLSYTNWIYDQPDNFSDQPDNYGNHENCLDFKESGKWNDLLCDYKRKYVCESRA